MLASIPTYCLVSFDVSARNYATSEDAAKMIDLNTIDQNV